MKKWRPDFRCFYVVPEVMGNWDSFDLMLQRIFPLRKFANQRDDIIFLGGYIDGMSGGCQVIEKLINITAEYGERVRCLLGAPEHRLLRALDGSATDYQDWIISGGVKTIEGYMAQSGLNGGASSLPQNRLRDVIPKSHINFLRSLPCSYETDEYLFVYGGLNTKLSIRDNNPTTFVLDTITNREFARAAKDGKQIDVEKIVVATYNSTETPKIYPRYLCLGGGAPKKLIAIDLNSMEAVAIRARKNRIYPTKIVVCE